MKKNNSAPYPHKPGTKSFEWGIFTFSMFIVFEIDPKGMSFFGIIVIVMAITSIFFGIKQLILKREYKLTLIIFFSSIIGILLGSFSLIWTTLALCYLYAQ